MKSAIAAVLSPDATLAALLPGGVHTASEISRQLTPTAFEVDSEGQPTFLRPCCLVKLRAARADLSQIPGTARESVELYFYGPDDVIEAARRRARALLDGTPVALGVGFPTMVGLEWQIDVIGGRDDALGTPMCMSRYQAATKG